MKIIPQEVPTLGKVWTEITSLVHEPYCREHWGEFSLWAAFLLVVGAIVRWFPRPDRFARVVRADCHVIPHRRGR